MKTKEQRREEYKAKKAAEKARREAENRWHDYEMSICYSEDFSVIEGYWEYIIYVDRETKIYHVDFVHGMKFTASNLRECWDLVKTFN